MNTGENTAWALRSALEKLLENNTQRSSKAASSQAKVKKFRKYTSA